MWKSISCLKPRSKLDVVFKIIGPNCLRGLVVQFQTFSSVGMFLEAALLKYGP